MTDERRTYVPVPSSTEDRIDYDERGDLDNVVLGNVTMFRMERLDDGLFWIWCHRDDQPDVAFYLTSKRKISGSHELD